MERIKKEGDCCFLKHAVFLLKKEWHDNFQVTHKKSTYCDCIKSDCKKKKGKERNSNTSL